jgi:hypothetical protein
MQRLLPLLIPLAACSGPGPVPERPRPVAPPAVEAAGEEWMKVLQEAMKGRDAGEEERILASNLHYRLALACMDKGEFDKAKIEAQRAVSLWLENLPARKLLQEVGEILTGSPGNPFRTPHDLDVRVQLVRVEQAQLEVTMHVLHGKRCLDARMHESALREFEDAEFKILQVPYDVKALNELLPEVRALKARAKGGLRAP